MQSDLMLKALWQPARSVLLAITLGGVLVVLGKAIGALTTPASSKPTFNQSRTLPSTVSLSGWNFLRATDRQPIPAQPLGRQYQYRQGNATLEVQMQYVMGNGDVKLYLFAHTPLRPVSSSLQVKHQPEVGFYGVLSHQGRTYLSACVNPRGSSTVTEQQFVQNRYTHDLKADRLLPWILGQEPLLDRRCLWVLMSLSQQAKDGDTASDTASEEAYADLEDAWFSWYRWLQTNFSPI